MINKNNFFFTFDFYPKIGGAHLWLYEVAKNWPEPTVVVTSHFPDLLAEQRIFDTQTHGAIKEIKRFPFQVDSWGIDLNFFKNFWRLFRFFKKNISSKPIIVHSIKAIPETVCLLFIKFVLGNKLKIITYAHGEEFLVVQTSRQLKRLTKLALNCSDIIIANSFFTKRLASFFCNTSKIEVVHLGVDYTRYQIAVTERNAWRKKWGFPKNTVILITVARMELRKNQAAVIKAVAELRKENLPLAYVLGGQGEEEERLKRLANDLGIRQWVRFLGRLSEEDKIRSFCAADIHVMPSIRVGPMIEGFGIVFMEAAAAGLPSIAGNVGGQAEAVIDGKTGFIVDGTNLNSVKEKIRILASNVNLRRKMGIEAKHWAIKHDWREVASKIQSLVKDAI